VRDVGPKGRDRAAVCAGSTPLRTVVSCVTEPQPDPGAAGGTPKSAVHRNDHDRHRAVPRRDERVGRVRAAEVPVPRPVHRGRLLGLAGGGRALPPVRVAGLPLGAPRRHRAGAAGLGGGGLHVGGGPGARRARLGLPRGARPRPRPGVRLPVPVRSVPAHRPGVHRPLHRAVHLGPRDGAPGDQQLPGHHPRLRDAVHRLPPARRPRPVPGAAARRDRRDQRDGLPGREQRGVPGRLRHVAGGRTRRR
jgi:hypothetical protein